MSLLNPGYDTWDLASMFLPRLSRYSLEYLARHFDLGDKSFWRETRHGRHQDHRALDDARAAMQVFLRLLRLAQEQDDGLLRYISHLAARSNWPIGQVISGLNGKDAGGPSAVGLTGLDTAQIAARHRRPGKAPPRRLPGRPGRRWRLRPAGAPGAFRQRLPPVSSGAASRKRCSAP